MESKLPSISELYYSKSLTPTVWNAKYRSQTLRFELLRMLAEGKAFTNKYIRIEKRIKFLEYVQSEFYERENCFKRFLQLRKKYYQY